MDLCWRDTVAVKIDDGGSMGQSVQVLPTRPVAPVQGPTLRRRTSAWAGSTPGRLTALMALVVSLGLLVGVAGVLGTVHRAGLVDAVRTRSGPLTVSAQQLYRSLSDADATAAAAFLSSGVEPAALRDRYQSDIAAASAALTQAAGASDSDQDAVRQIAGALPVYTALVETARAYNRMNLPLGAAYLREASGLMRERLLPAAQRLYQSRTGRLATDRGAAAGLPWVAALLVLLSLGALVVGQVYLVRRTHRLVNLGLATATLAALALLVWLVVSWAGAASALHAGQREGSAQVELMSQGRIHALQARADEALTLVAHGSGGGFENDFATEFDRLTGDLNQARRGAGDAAVRGALQDALDKAAAWKAAHTKVRTADDGGRYSDAVTLAVGTSDQAGAAASFNALDADLARSIGVANAAFDMDAARAGDSLSGTGVGFLLLTLVLLAGVVAGFQQRIGEYR
ncbi:MAG: hypothetical protein V7603_112 [Micromonosporaceae bacterium]